MKNYSLAKFGSTSWLKQLKEALNTPGFSITPPKKPLDFGNKCFTDKQKHNIQIARTLIEAQKL